MGNSDLFRAYFLLATMIARLRAELGFLVHDLHRVDPHGLIVTAFGTQRLTTSTKTVFSLYMFFNRAYRAHPMPQELEALKISERRQIRPQHTAAGNCYCDPRRCDRYILATLGQLLQTWRRDRLLRSLGIRVWQRRLSTT